jgi:hypothetical protein
MDEKVQRDIEIDQQFFEEMVVVPNCIMMYFAEHRTRRQSRLFNELIDKKQIIYLLIDRCFLISNGFMREDR